jgi:putative FmdB family regulatory protein
MPKYDYRCARGHVYEKRESFSAPAVQECQECGTEARRVLTPPAIVFKGSGWYKTDSRGSAPSDSSTASSPSDSSSATPETKTDTTATPSAPASAAAD